jgi:hypothetical protein
MAINIQSLFSDIIETPAQTQQRQLQEGLLRAQQATSGLTGLARTQAPLVSALYQNLGQRQDAIRRGFGGMLGLDVRTQSEKLSDIIKSADASTPAGMINLSKAIQEYAPTQALTLRQAAIEEQQRLADRERQARLQNLQIQEAERKATEAQESKSVRESNAQSYRDLGVPDALVNDYIAGNITAAQMNQAHSQSLAARARSIPEYKTLSGQGLEDVKLAMDDNDAVQELLSLKGEPQGILSQYLPFLRDNVYSEQDFIAEVSMIMEIEKQMTPSEAVDRAVSTLPMGGILSTIAIRDPEGAERLRTQVVRSVQPMGAVNPAALAAGSGLETPQPSLESPDGAEEVESNALDLTQQVIEFRESLGSGPSPEAPVVNDDEMLLGVINTNRPVARTRFSQGIADTASSLAQGIADTASGLASGYMESRQRRQAANREIERQLDKIMADNNVSRNEAYNIYARQVAENTSLLPDIEVPRMNLGDSPRLQIPEMRMPRQNLGDSPRLEIPEMRMPRQNLGDSPRIDLSIDEAVSNIAESARSLPDIANKMADITSATLATINARESVAGAVDATLKNTLRATGRMIDTLSEGQSKNPESLINSINEKIGQIESRLDDVVIPLQLRRQIDQSMIAYRQLLDAAKQRFGSE